MLFVREMIKTHISTNMPMFLKTTNPFYLSYAIEVSIKNLKIKTSTLSIFPSRLPLLQDSSRGWRWHHPSMVGRETPVISSCGSFSPRDMPSVSTAASSREHHLCDLPLWSKGFSFACSQRPLPLSPNPSSTVSSGFLTSSPTLPENTWGVHSVKRTKS